MDIKQVPTMYCPQETHFLASETESEGMEKDISNKWKQTNKQTGIPIPISDKITFKLKMIKRG